MPYDPGNPEAFRAILRQLSAQENLVSAAIIRLVENDLKDKPNRAPLNMTRSTLDRFKRGKAARHIPGLREIWRVLESHPNYGRYFPVSATPQTAAADATLVSALPRFFSANIQQPSYDLSSIGDKIAGTYVMYRPDWRPRIPTGLARASIVKIAAAASGFSISETQNFPATATERAYWQHDTGAMASFARFIYFLMKEEKAPGTAVKFGLINTLFPNSGDSVVDWFRGIVFTASNLNIYPLAKFFCKRVDDEHAIQCRLMKMEEIPDEDAKMYLLPPLKLPG
jgi:hypothetical protein